MKRTPTNKDILQTEDTKFMGGKKERNYSHITYSWLEFARCLCLSECVSFYVFFKLFAGKGFCASLSTVNA